MSKIVVLQDNFFQRYCVARKRGPSQRRPIEGSNAGRAAFPRSTHAGLAHIFRVVHGATKSTGVLAKAKFHHSRRLPIGMVNDQSIALPFTAMTRQVDETPHNVA
jgi:hypothetical protein